LREIEKKDFQQIHRTEVKLKAKNRGGKKTGRVLTCQKREKKEKEGKKRDRGK